MKNIVIGTSGHIDHGKTTLIKALTGTDTDRLKEEKKRGITIELGFAHFDLPSGRRAGIIDVPGHERFIKNMLAGVGGIDIVLLVVAADEGFMPQTQEHLNILSILEVKKGIIVLTKTDKVDEEWLELVQEEVRQKTNGTFLESSPIIPVSSSQGIGLEKLVQLIDQLTEETEEKDMRTPFRLPVDRVFTLSGFGTVVTGTQIEGTLATDSLITIYPQDIQAKIRSIQVHGKSVNESYAGQRVAVNLAGIKVEEILRGNVLAEKNSMKSTTMLDIKLNLLKDVSRVLKNRERLRFHHGTSEIFCRVVLLDREELEPGDSCYAQLRLEEYTVAKRGDHFVLRFYSPMETIGGGIILEPNPKKHKRFKEDTLEDLKVKEEGSPEDIIDKIIKQYGNKFETIGYYATQTGMSETMIEEIIGNLILEGSVIRFSNQITHRTYLDTVEEEIIKLLNEYHGKYPLKAGMLKEELRNKVLPHAKGRLYDSLLEHYEKNQIIKVKGNIVSAYNFEVDFTEEQEKIKNEIENIYLKAEFNPPMPEEFIKSNKDEKHNRMVFNALLDMNRLVKINDEIVFHVEHYDRAIEILKEFIQQHKEITLSQFRDCLNTTRKYALPLLEHFDQIKLTKRTGDKRILF
ncbi:selenocysteine-specific elongation factor [Anaerosolibacter carboniphilus]|uniref:Selenocysteine-specific elongation factor n=1 Tax=Anaerosolibacter carboniphilus TaxID=1417629 RepID=A0A841KRT2_9FIRM|nr:selenocysteine-specific translation elongation factor [Anaerosolibacter carboniphilus]MBB6214858.1 selenocysteine-specific elongation factor [Anaerosolibacter carboniphilus]